MLNTQKPTLVIMAAGMGSRYGGLKQLDAFTKEGDTIIDFSVYDALKAGFGKIVFVIRRHFAKEFEAIFTPKLEPHVKVSYVFQEIDDVPNSFNIGSRTKPWGTGHALLAAKDEIEGNFAIINADDFYGREAFELLANQLRGTSVDSNDVCMVGYQLKNTVSVNGYVSRGVCTMSKKNLLEKVEEFTHIEIEHGELINKKGDGSIEVLDQDTTVSMNVWGFTPQCFKYATKYFEEFLEIHGKDDKAEFYLPSIVSRMIDEKLTDVAVLKTKSKWFGVTYSEDKKEVVQALEQLKLLGVYPTMLW